MKCDYKKFDYHDVIDVSIGRNDYIHNIIGHCNPTVRIINLVFHTTYVVRVFILYINGGTYSLKLIPNDRVFEKLFIAILFTLRVFVRNLLKGNRRRNTFFVFRFDMWLGARALALRLTSQHTT